MQLPPSLVAYAGLAVLSYASLFAPFTSASASASAQSHAATLRLLHSPYPCHLVHSRPRPPSHIRASCSISPHLRDWILRRVCPHFTSCFSIQPRPATMTSRQIRPSNLRWVEFGNGSDARSAVPSRAQSAPLRPFPAPRPHRTRTTKRRAPLAI